MLIRFADTPAGWKQVVYPAGQHVHPPKPKSFVFNEVEAGTVAVQRERFPPEIGQRLFPAQGNARQYTLVSSDRKCKGMIRNNLVLGDFTDPCSCLNHMKVIQRSQQVVLVSCGEKAHLLTVQEEPDLVGVIHPFTGSAKFFFCRSSKFAPGVRASGACLAVLSPDRKEETLSPDTMEETLVADA